MTWNLQRCFSPRPRPPNGSASRLARPSNIAGRARRPPPEARYPRMSATTGNPTFLGAYMQAIALLALALGVRAAGSAGGDAYQPAFDNILLERATSVKRIGNTLAPRLRNWRSGLLAFAERPLLGWGTGNYFAGSARHADEVAQLLRRVRFDVDHPQSPAGISATTRRWGAAQSSGPQCRARARSAVAKRSAYRAVISRRWR